MILNANAENGSSSEEGRVVSSSEPGITPLIGGMSIGAGM